MDSTQHITPIDDPQTPGIEHVDEHVGGGRVHLHSLEMMISNNFTRVY